MVTTLLAFTIVFCLVFLLLCRRNNSDRARDLQPLKVRLEPLPPDSAWRTLKVVEEDE